MLRISMRRNMRSINPSLRRTRRRSVRGLSKSINLDKIVRAKARTKRQTCQKVTPCCLTMTMCRRPKPKGQSRPQGRPKRRLAPKPRKRGLLPRLEGRKSLLMKTKTKTKTKMKSSSSTRMRKRGRGRRNLELRLLGALHSQIIIFYHGDRVAVMHQRKRQRNPPRGKPPRVR